MKSIVLGLGLVTLFAGVGCTVGVDTGVGGGGGGPACEAVTCGDALVNGLSVQGDALCSVPEDDAYAAVFGCGCGDSGGAGACEVECGDNLCVDGGESPACGDCLNANCGPEQDSCVNP